MSVVGVLHHRWRDDMSAPVPWRKPWQRFRKGVWFKANPRPAGYLEAAFAGRFPGGRLISTPGAGELRSARTVVLVYPDAIGLGCSSIERRVRRVAPRGAELLVLNGRNRVFPLTRMTLIRLRVRRLLEWTMAPETIAAVVMVPAGCVLALWDFLRGRR